MHKLEYEKWGRQEDLLAWLGLAGLIDKAEIAKRLLILSNQKRKGSTQSTEVIAKRKAAMKGISKSKSHKAKLAAANRGKKQDPEVVARRSATATGKKRSSEFCRKNSERMIGNQYGKKPRTDEARKNISLAAKLRWQRTRDHENSKNNTKNKDKNEAQETIAVQ